jgi:type II secretory pathway pseudopilin PulG
MNKGSSILEVLIALAILTLGISAAILLVFGNQSLKIDNETNSEALYQAKGLLERARASSTSDFLSINTIPAATSSIYSLKLDVLDLTQCRKEATSTVTWSVSPLRTLKIELTTDLTDIAAAFAMGGDCAAEPPSSGWTDPQRFASDTLNPGKTTAIDVLDKIAYLGADKEPFLYIADTRGAVLGQNSGMLIGIGSNKFTNLFNDDGKTIDVINDIDVYKDIASGKVYALIAMASSTAQFAVIDVTDIYNPSLLALRKLNNVVSGGMTSHGYRVYYNDRKAYMVTRETAGPEFHIFDLNTPGSPSELGSGTKLIGPTPPNGTTANDLVVRNDIAYFAAEKNSAELLIYNVSVPTLPSFMPDATVNLSGNENGSSLYFIGNKLYFGRESVSGVGAELYIFDATNSLTAVGGLPVIGTPVNIGGGILDMFVAGQFGFIVSSKVNEEFQVWNISNPSDIFFISKLNFGNIVAGGLDYEPDFIYATGDATPNFQILYSP